MERNDTTKRKCLARSKRYGGKIHFYSSIHLIEKYYEFTMIHFRITIFEVKMKKDYELCSLIVSFLLVKPYEETESDEILLIRCAVKQ